MLKRVRFCSRILSVLFLSSISVVGIAQDNSPYSRYGLGDVVPSSSITTRGMGGISGGYADFTSINFNNPASYANFLAVKEKSSHKLQYGRVIMDVGINYSDRTLIAPNTPNRFTASELLFSYLQVGIPLRKNWGLSFGLRPMTRISYLINQQQPFDSSTSMITQSKGTGGSYLPTIGTGFGFNLADHETSRSKKTSMVSFGINGGYMFGSRENQTLRSLLDTSTHYYSSDHTTNTSFGDLFFNSGMQLQFEHLDKIKKQNSTFRLGVSGNWKQTLAGTKDSLRQTFTRGNAGEEIRIDSVFQTTSQGNVVYPGSFRAGITYQKTDMQTGRSWLFGADYTTTKWSGYRFFGQADAVQDNWQVSVGAQYYPRPKSNYFSRVVYRFGVSSGTDYIKVQNSLSTLNFSYGMGLPIGGYNRLSPNSFSMLNLAFEYGKRGNNNNLLKENIFRISAGFNLSDLWFIKKKYD